MSEPIQTVPAVSPVPAQRGKPAFAVALVGMVLCLAAPIALLLSLLELSKQKQERQANRKAKRFAQAGLVLSILSLVIWTPVLIYGYVAFQKVVCKTNMYYGLGYALQMYEHDFKALPTPERWCDLLIENTDVSTKAFFCPASDAVEGECTYALNKHLFNAPFSQLPGDIVMIFETDSGKVEGQRTSSVRDRRFFQSLQNQGREWVETLNDTKVFPNRWNQIGGPEIAAANHRGKCHVVLLNGTIEAVNMSQLETLRWTAE